MKPQAKDATLANRTLLRDGANVIPQVTEERKGEESAAQIALVHRRYVLGAGAEFKKLVFKDEQSTKLVLAPHYIAPQTAPPSQPLAIRRPRPAFEHQPAAPSGVQKPEFQYADELAPSHGHAG